MSNGDILVTYSPCCKMVRIGEHSPGVMHSGLCRERNGGRLGPTVYLIESHRILASVSGNQYSTVHGKDESGTAPGTAREAREDGPEAV